jgi:hypothetical protein
MRFGILSKTIVRRSVVGLIAILLVLAGTGLTIPGARPMDVAAQGVTTAGAPTGDVPAVLNNRVYLPFVAKQEKQVFPPPTLFGVQMYAPLNTPEAALDLAGSAQVSWVRWPVRWGDIEPTPTTPALYSWSRTDASLSAASTAGIRVIGTIDGNPAWAAQFPSGPIDRAGNDAFVEFVGALVERYDGDGLMDAPGSPVVNHWEFYNEPDGGNELYGQYGGSVWGHYGAEYAQLLCAAYPAMKAADPNVKIVFGGIAYDYFEADGGPFVREFLDEVLVAGGGRCIDFMDFHYYPYFEARWTPYGPGLSGKTNYLRSKLEAYGLGSLPFVITEAGHHSNAYPEQPSSPEIQSAYVVKLFTQAISSNIQAMIWFSWYDLTGYWAATGLLTVNLEPKPSYTAFRVARNKLGTSLFQRRLTTDEVGSSDVEAYLFHKSNPIYVVWVDGTAVRQVKLPGHSARVSDPLDTTIANLLDANDGRTDGMITVTASSSPIYVEILEQ